MIGQTVIINGKSRQLGRRIGKGGEGEIYLLADDKTLAVKVYTVSQLQDRPAKIRALVDGKLAEKAPLVAFPISEVHAKSGVFVGFAMRLVEGYKPLHELYAPGSRKIHFPRADFRFLVRTASNIARAVASVHRSGCVIGDINHSGILISPQAVVALIDADSFQVTTRMGQFLCSVGVPEYTPPEFQGKSLAGLVRAPNHDAFGLAVVIFQLLFMGRHPFVGTVRKGDIPPLHENIRAFKYVYAENRDVGMDQPPGTPDISDFHPALAASFDKAFSREDANARPSAEDWVEVLDALEHSLVKCQNNALHYVPKGASECAWCDMERQLGSILFLPYIAAGPFSVGTDPGAVSFNLDALWRRILEIKASTETRLSPKLGVSSVAPSDAARKAKSAAGQGNGWGIAIIIAAVCGLIAVPKGFVLWGALFLFGLGAAKSKKTLDGTPFKTGYVASEQLLSREVVNWGKRNGIEDFLKLFAELESARDEYVLLKKEEERQIARVTNDKQSAQLHAYLDTFPIEHANIRGIGPATRAAMASFGIDTAADIVAGRIQNVPGIGNVLSKSLVTWREKLEKQFVFRPDATGASQAAIARVQIQTEIKTGPLRAKLIVGPQNLTMLVTRMRQIASTEDVVLARAKLQRDQARCDLEFLGIPPPHIAAPPAPHSGGAAPYRHPSPPAAPQFPSQRTSPPSPVSPSPGTPQSAAVACPRCGQPMVKRMARRGRNAGSYFFGCSRYPVCKGTRNI